jgi:DNA polymerase (family X)
MSFNAGASACFERIAKLLELLGEDSFRASANAKAARIIGDLAADLHPIATGAEAKKRLQEIEGVGPKIADKIIEFAATGKMKELDELSAKVPAGLVPLLEISGLGPKTLAVLWNQGGVTDLASLNRIIADGSILGLPRMGEKSVAKLKESIAMMATASARLPLGVAAQVGERVVAAMRKVPGVTAAEPAGSLRRAKETIGDIDVLVSTSDAAGASAAFRALPGITNVLVAGESKSSVRMLVNPDHGRWSGSIDPGEAKATVQVDLRVIPAGAWGAALAYFTGSKEHNVRLRQRALDMGLTLNEYGLFPEDGETEPPQKRGVKPVASKTEEEIYAKLGMPWIPPEMREDRGEVDLSAVPELVRIEDIRAELHAHTTASDGSMSIEELAERAKARGFHTIAVTDHSRSSAVAGGLSIERLLEHVEAVHAARKTVKGIAILAGSEVDILADGSLDYPDEVLAKLDVVVASPHTALSQDAATATKRLVRAVEHPRVNILGHPTGRLIGRRAGLSPDLSAVFAAAKANGVALEINSHWMRLDLRDTHVRAAVEAGCVLAIDCDVHEPADFECLKFGVATGRRGWLTRERCVNTWSAGALLDWLRKKGSRG